MTNVTTLAFLPLFLIRITIASKGLPFGESLFLTHMIYLLPKIGHHILGVNWHSESFDGCLQIIGIIESQFTLTSLSTLNLFKSICKTYLLHKIQFLGFVVLTYFSLLVGFNINQLVKTMNVNCGFK